MFCLKCGRETEKETVFCDSCLEIMEKYPVKPGTHIHIPRREAVILPKKSSRRKILPPEEQVLHLRRSLRRSRILLFFTVLILGGLLIWQFFFYKPLPPEQAQIPATEPLTTVAPTTENVSRETIPSLTKPTVN